MSPRLNSIANRWIHLRGFKPVGIVLAMGNMQRAAIVFVCAYRASTDVKNTR